MVKLFSIIVFGSFVCAIAVRAIVQPAFGLSSNTAELLSLLLGIPVGGIASSMYAHDQRRKR